VNAVESEFGHGRAPALCRSLLDGEAMTEVCREFGVSRKTGYKIFDRYKENGLAALVFGEGTDRAGHPSAWLLFLRSSPDRLHQRFTRVRTH
jgi:hypothetical protein